MVNAEVSSSTSAYYSAKRDVRIVVVVIHHRLVNMSDAIRYGSSAWYGDAAKRITSPYYVTYWLDAGCIAAPVVRIKQR